MILTSHKSLVILLAKLTNSPYQAITNFLALLGHLPGLMLKNNRSIWVLKMAKTPNWGLLWTWLVNLTHAAIKLVLIWMTFLKLIWLTFKTRCTMVWLNLWKEWQSQRLHWSASVVTQRLSKSSLWFSHMQTKLKKSLMAMTKLSLQIKESTLRS